MRINAHDLCTTRTCEAADCPDDATIWGLCTRHHKQQSNGTHVRMHVIPDPLPDKPRRKIPNRMPRAAMSAEEVTRQRELDTAKRKRRRLRQVERESLNQPQVRQVEG